MAGVGAVGSVVYWLSAPWEPKTDFDMIGFLYFARNGPHFLAMAGLFMITLLGIGLWRENRG